MYKEFVTLRNYFLFSLFCFTLISTSAYAEIDRSKKNSEGEEALRAATDVFDNQQNKVSRVQFFISNYGIFGYDVKRQIGGGIWPRGTSNQYIFAGGVWLATQKRLQPEDPTLQKLCLISYNPNSGRSWMAPGRISDGENAQASLLAKHRVYFSTDFNPGTGEAKNKADGPNWPIWDTKESEVLKTNRYFGYYIDSESDRTISKYPKGPAFISQEDIFATYKDTDLSRYEGGQSTRRREGYPLRIQTEQTLYSWGFGDYRDFIFLKYNLINTSKDTLRQTWIAPVFDVDIALTTNSTNGARNDNARFVDEKAHFNLAAQWSLGTAGEQSRGFGYLGFDFLESPAVYPYTRIDTVIKNGKEEYVPVVVGAHPDSIGKIRKDRRFYPNAEQLGLKTFRNWPIAEDPLTNERRYDFVSTGARDGQGEPGDKRFMMASGPFDVIPGDSVRTVVGIVLAKTSKGGDADGSIEDMADLIRLDSFAQIVYDNNFKAPKPPDPARIRFRGINNGVVIQWDSTSDLSFDDLERGMDFKGYKLYRARRTDLDTFNVDYMPNASPSAGPFGWKEIASWDVPNPFLASRRYPNNDRTLTPYDSIRIVSQIDSFTYVVRRFPNGISSFRPYGIAPWEQYYRSLSKVMDDTLFLGVIKAEQAYKEVFPHLTTANNYGKPFIPDSNAAANFWPTVQGKEMPFNPDTNNSTGGVSLRNVIINTKGIGFKKTTMKLHTMVHDSLFTLLKKGQVKMRFRDFTKSMETIDSQRINTRHIAETVIIPYVDSITRNRTFFDVGDDDKDGTIKNLIDPTQTERLLNNTDYFYRLLAYDEGDYIQSTNTKINSGVDDENQIKAIPLSGGFAKEPNSIIDIIAIDSSRIGGLHNFQFHVLDQSRFNRLFMNEREGHLLRIGFLNTPFISRWRFDRDPGKTNTAFEDVDFGVYATGFRLEDLTTNEILYEGFTTFEENLCRRPIASFFTDNGATARDSENVIRAYSFLSRSGDTIDFANPTGRGVLNKTGKITTVPLSTSNECYSSNVRNDANQTLAFSFDWNIRQYGGEYRPDFARITTNNSNADTRVFAGLNFGRKADDNEVPVEVTIGNNQRVTLNFTAGTRKFNHGPGEFELEFLPGGTERKTITVGSGTSTKSYDVDIPYLNVKMKNVTAFNRPDVSGDSVLVKYVENVDHAELPLTDGVLDDNQMPVSSFNISSFGWTNVDTSDRFSIQKQRLTTAGLIGQGKYYLPTTINSTVDSNLFFVNQIKVYGCDFYIDLSGRNRITTSSGEVYPVSGLRKLPSERKDFQAGDKIRFKTTGGALGFPMDSAFVLARVRPNIPNDNEVNDDQLANAVRVVPNPFYVTNQSQKSSYDAKVSFTNLPRRCTIKIYTVAGDLVSTIEHDENTGSSPEKEATEVYDLLNKSGRRAASQTLIAIIETPNGARARLPFSIVVGSFRLTAD